MQGFFLGGIYMPCKNINKYLHPVQSIVEVLLYCRRGL